MRCRLGNTMTDEDAEQAATWRELAIAAVFGFLAGYGAVALVTHLIVGYQYTAGTLHPWPCSPGLQPASTMSEGARALKHGTGATANAQTGATGPQTVLHAFSRKRLCTILMQLCLWPPRSIGGLAEHGLTARYVTLPLCSGGLALSDKSRRNKPSDAFSCGCQTTSAGGHCLGTCAGSGQCHGNIRRRRLSRCHTLRVRCPRRPPGRTTCP